MKKSVKKYTEKTISILYNTGGICYSRIGFPKTAQGKKDAELLSKEIKKDEDYANGGMFDGMPMGGIHEYKDRIEVYMNFYNLYSEFNVVDLSDNCSGICGYSECECE
tara:strand:- start:3159 stop:3482 length:324 start_codon:yes stop_codon:yes gene_type:complete